jgi:hypothetical protein
MAASYSRGANAAGTGADGEKVIIVFGFGHGDPPVA